VEQILDATDGLASHELPLGRAAEGDERFDKREDGWTEVLLRPGSLG
jgi:glutathione-independent formaldehyde dehydrogenase